jgi:hypothetical protein
MTPHVKPTDDADSISPDYFARRTSLDDEDGESIVSRPLARQFNPIGEEDAGTASRSPAPAEDVGANGLGSPPAQRPEELRTFSVLRGRKRAILAEQNSRWEEGKPVPPEDLLRRWPTDPATDPDAASLLFEDYFQRRKHGENPSLGD